MISKHPYNQPAIMIIAKIHPNMRWRLLKCLFMIVSSLCDSVKMLCILMLKLRNASVQRNIDPTDQLISAETIQFPAMEEELGGVQYTVHADTDTGL